MLYNFKNFFRNLKYYFKNIIKWSPILWQDRDWDHNYIISALRFKIEKTAKYISENRRYVGYERDVERMNLVIRLIDKMQDEYYSCEYQDYYKSDFRFEKIENSELSLLHSDMLENNLEEYFKKYPNTYKLFPEHNENLKIALRMGNHLHAKCKRILFKLLEQNIEKWWD
jgi:hypothetical protein